MTALPRIYDNDAATLARDQERIEELLRQVSTALKVVAVRDNGDAIDPYDTASNQQDRENYYVLNKCSLPYEAQLRQQVEQQLPRRFALQAMNHIFEQRAGDECFFSTEEMTLAIKRVACLLRDDGGDHDDFAVRRLVCNAVVLLVVAYAALHLWRLL